MSNEHQLKMKKTILSTFICLIFHQVILAQAWTPDLGNGTYKNPIVFADYSDPDLIRAGDDFYMVASSFNCMPGIPILHSKDLVNWEIVNHVYDRLPLERYDKPVHGEGSWAPSIREHDGKFYVYFCTPHDGLFMAVADHPEGKWELHMVEQVELWEDPCPIWDEDGNAYLIRSKVCANELYLHKLSKDGKKLLDNGKLIFRDIANQPVIEGPKFLKKDGYYYILSPAGSVPAGWQTVLRSKNIYGPYEFKNVLHQGNTDINGPHQGGLVELKSGEWWFVHFQSRGHFGRIVHLQPVNWIDGWPMMGVDQNDDGIGEPVMKYKKPNVGKSYPIVNPQTSDEFNGNRLGLQWQWPANPKQEWYTLKDGKIRLNAVKNISQNGNLWMVPNLLLQKFPSPSFSARTKIELDADLTGDRAGLVIMGEEWASVALEKTDKGIEIKYFEGDYNQCSDRTEDIAAVPINANSCYFQVNVNEYGICQFSYSPGGQKYEKIGREFKARPGRWIGAKVGLFCLSPNIPKSKGYAEVDWFRVE